MLHVLMESATAGALMMKLLHDEYVAGQVDFAISVPTSSLYGKARTLLGIRSEPVAVVLDAESTDEDAVERRRQSAEEVIGDAVRRTAFRVFIAVPSLESLFFRRPETVRRVFPQASESVIEVGKISPQNALRRLEPTSSGPAVSSRLVQGLNEEDVTALRSESPIRELLEFLAELQKAGMGTAAAAL